MHQVRKKKNFQETLDEIETKASCRLNKGYVSRENVIFGAESQPHCLS